MPSEPKPLPEDRESAAIEVLRRIYQCDFGRGEVHDADMHIIRADEEVMAFIRQFGPLPGARA